MRCSYLPAFVNSFPHNPLFAQEMAHIGQSGAEQRATSDNSIQAQE
jgi:hypothetical protein